MAQLRHDFEKFSAQEAVILVIGIDQPGAFAKYWKDNDLPFVGLPDPDRTVLKRYGQEVKLFKFGRMPAQAVIDKTGIIRYIHYGNSMSDIPANAEILEILADLNQGQEPLERHAE